MQSTRRTSTRFIFFATAAVLIAGMANAQNNRIRAYTKSLEQAVTSELATYQVPSTPKNETDATKSPRLDWPAKTREATAAANASVNEVKTTPDRTSKPFKSVVNVTDSRDGEGQDAEIRLTMPIDDFMAFAPIAALEAAAIPHKFPVVNIYLREETSDRVGRVAFADAEPIAARYRAGDEDAVDDMNDILIWH